VSVTMETDKRWSLAGKTALVTGGTRGIGFVAPLFCIIRFHYLTTD